MQRLLFYSLCPSYANMYVPVVKEAVLLRSCHTILHHIVQLYYHHHKSQVVGEMYAYYRNVARPQHRCYYIIVLVVCPVYKKIL